MLASPSVQEGKPGAFDRGLMNGEAGLGQQIAPGSSAMAFDPSMPVLVVDDYSTMVRIIRNLLRQLGFSDIDDANDGAAALAKMRAKRYGLVISDWNMEPMSGYELLREVRADPALSETPFIMVTAESKTDNVIAARKAGVSNYIVKPFNAQTLRAKIEAVFAAAGEPARPAQSTIRKSANRFVDHVTLHGENHSAIDST